MGLDERIQVRVSRWEKEQVEKYRIDASKVCRMAIKKKLREIVTDPQIVIDAGETGPAAIYIQAWNRIMPGITAMLKDEDYAWLKKSEEKLQDLKGMVDLSIMKPMEIQYLGIFLQGGDLSEKILMACIEAHL